MVVDGSNFLLLVFLYISNWPPCFLKFRYVPYHFIGYCSILYYFVWLFDILSHHMLIYFCLILCHVLTFYFIICICFTLSISFFITNPPFWLILIFFTFLLNIFLIFLCFLRLPPNCTAESCLDFQYVKFSQPLVHRHQRTVCRNTRWCGGLWHLDK